MKKAIGLLISAFIMLFSSTGLAYHIEVLQVGDIVVFQEGYKGFLSELEKNGIVEGKNLTINRRIIDAFGIPIDSYYDLNEGKATRDLADISKKSKIPSIAFVTHTTLKGSLMYMGCDFKTVGGLAGKNAVEILVNGKKPEDLPVLKQEDITILVDVEVIKELGVDIPIGILQLAKEI